MSVIQFYIHDRLQWKWCFRPNQLHVSFRWPPSNNHLLLIRLFLYKSVYHLNSHRLRLLPLFLILFYIRLKTYLATFSTTIIIISYLLTDTHRSASRTLGLFYGFLKLISTVVFHYFLFGCCYSTGLLALAYVAARASVPFKTDTQYYTLPVLTFTGRQHG